jgi:hypothetical protein
VRDELARVVAQRQAVLEQTIVPTPAETLAAMAGT